MQFERVEIFTRGREIITEECLVLQLALPELGDQKELELLPLPLGEEIMVHFHSRCLKVQGWYFAL